jgi:acyl-coenzyme A synthetase/AMP-(fatty) acid ligase/thioesterase domain-containing protein/acyl carrier protein
MAMTSSIAERFREVAASNPDAPALLSSRARYTYGEFDRWSDAIAAEIAAMHAPREHPVAIVTGDPIALVPAVLGAVKAGHFFVAIDESDPRREAILRACNATVWRPSPFREAATPVMTGTPHDLVQLIFTSGTTGVPKAVAVRQESFVERSLRAAARTGRVAGERVSYTALPGFARATGEILGSLLNGATLCAFDARGETLDVLASMIERERISTLALTPALFRRFMRALPASTNLSSVRKLRIGADVMTTADVDAWRARFPRTTTLERGFNATEAGMVLHMTITHEMEIPGPLVPMGRPLPGVEVRLLDEDGNESDFGEMVVRSASVAHGYWNAPELTAEKFSFEQPGTPAFRTGDLVRRGEDGLYYFVGRRDSRLKIYGRRIDPLEVETALVTHAGVREAAAVAQPAGDGELRLVAYVVASDAPREIRAAVRGALPAWMIPARVHVLDALPMSASGKVDREALTRRVEAVEPAGEEARDDAERMLLALWSRVLGTAVRAGDDFFDLGGDSLTAAEIVSEVNRLTGRSMPLSLLLELNTVEKMAEYLRMPADASRTVIAIQRDGSLPPLFCVSGKGGSVIVFRRLAALLGSDQPFYGLTHHGIDPSSSPKNVAALAASYIDAVRATQPHGPYAIAGYSAGGFIAYEIARQLTRAGEEVVFTGLIDTAIAREQLPAWKRVARQATIFRRRPRTTAARYLRALARRAMWLARWVRNGGTQPFRPRPSAEVLANNAFFESLERQRAVQPYDGPVTLFLAKQGDGSRPAAGWDAYCPNVRVIEVEGEHYTIIRDEVRYLASAFARALAEARAITRVRADARPFASLSPSQTR